MYYYTIFVFVLRMSTILNLHFACDPENFYRVTKIAVTLFQLVKLNESIKYGR